MSTNRGNEAGPTLRRQFITSLVLLLPLVFSQAASAQSDTLRIPYSVSCIRCSVVFDSVATIGKVTDPVLLAPIFVLERDGKGRYYAIGYGNEQIVVFSNDGSFLRAFGGKGQGPGEFAGGGGALQVRIGQGDTIYVFDSARQVHVFAANFQYVRSHTLPGAPVRAAAVSNALVFSGNVPSAAAGFPMHRFSLRDASVTSFGAEQRAIRSSDAGSTGDIPRPFEMSADRASLIVNRDFSFHRWSVEGKDLGVVEVTDAPSPVPTGSREAGQSNRAGSLAAANVVNFIGADAQGRLWINRVSAGARAISSGPRVARGRLGIPNLLGRETAGSQASTLDIIDVGGKRVLLSQSVPVPMRFLAGGEYTFSVQVSQDGVRSYVVWRPRILGLAP